MTDVSHELGALRFVVDSPLSSKVAMFNNQATQHKQSQLLNPFSQDGRAASPKPTFSKDQYGKPLAGSLTEMRGQKANIHVMKEMLELCQIINSEGYDVKDEPTMRVIPFGELFNIYNYISDKVVGILLRARKHKLVDFEGEMLYQRRDDDVPVFLLKPIKEIRSEMEAKIEDIKRAASPAPPQSTSVLMDRSAHEQKLKSRTPSPAVGKSAKSKSASPAPKAPSPVTESTTAAVPAPSTEPTPATASAPVEAPVSSTVEIEPAKPEVTEQAPVAVIVTEAPSTEETTPTTSEPEAEEPAAAVAPSAPADDLPTIVIEATAEFVRTVSVEQLAPSPATASESSPDQSQSQPESTPA
ncbi:GM19201 [Drosophila sechellia]|uniref:GM19201 n=1 Tax=Drosophila sechellia TaxID=7238 RepID=B4I9Q5_DROSE|nr:GM19201 [Drosophila sechellia]